MTENAYRGQIEMLLFFLQLCRAVPKCADLDFWYLDCPFPGTNLTQDIADEAVVSVDCPESGFLTIECTPRVECEGTATKQVSCIPTKGKNGGTALLLSVLLGWLGIDRFYLGYPTIGLFKMFTGGFFGLGWYLDIFLIALQIVTPARGGCYGNVNDRSVIRMRLPNVHYF